MKIQDYIQKHKMVLWKAWPKFASLQETWMPAVFITQETSGKIEPFPHDEKFEIFANEEKTRFVSINVTRGMFRIVHNELIQMDSKWQPTSVNYEVQAIR